MAWAERMKDFHARRARARGMGGLERLARRRAAGALDARERVDRLLDPGSFLEVGTFNTSGVVIRFLAQARARTAIGRHRLAGWPTTF